MHSRFPRIDSCFPLSRKLFTRCDAAVAGIQILLAQIEHLRALDCGPFLTSREQLSIVQGRNICSEALFIRCLRRFPHLQRFFLGLQSCPQLQLRYLNRLQCLFIRCLRLYPRLQRVFIGLHSRPQLRFNRMQYLFIRCLRFYPHLQRFFLGLQSCPQLRLRYLNRMQCLLECTLLCVFI